LIRLRRQFVYTLLLAIRPRFCEARWMLSRNLPAHALALMLASLASTSAHAVGLQTYILDPVHTQVIFFADHLGLSHAVGRLKVKQGWFQFDADDWSTARVDVVIDMNSLDMGEAGWTDKLREPVFLGTSKWPTTRFIGNRFDKVSATHGILHGELWLRGIHQNVDLDVTFNGERNDPYAFKTKAGFTATTTLNRFDFGMSAFKDVVAGPVKLRIEVEGSLTRRSRKELESDAVEKQ
jgi:polyisoprenoid-binding protein YceI